MLALAMMFARLLVALIGLRIARSVVADVGLRLLRNEAGLLAEIRETFFVVALVGNHFSIGTRLRLILPELLLSSRDDAEIMFGVLVVVLGGHRIAGRPCVARQLDIFFRNVGRGTADLDVGSVRFEDPRHRVLTAPVIVVVIVVTVTHPLVVLTVSHVSPSNPALSYQRRIAVVQPWSSLHGDPARTHAHPIAMPFKSVPISPTVAFDKTRSPTAGAHRQRTKSFRLPKQAHFSYVSLQAQ
jgi:hypothetical protein